MLNVLSKWASVIWPRGGELAAAGVGEEDVEAAFLLLNGGEELVEIRKVRDIALDAECIRSEFLHGGIELRFAPAGDEDEGAFRDETLGGGEADAAVAAGHQSDFVFEFVRHGESLSEKKKERMDCHRSPGRNLKKSEARLPVAT